MMTNEQEQITGFNNIYTAERATRLSKIPYFRQLQPDTLHQLADELEECYFSTGDMLVAADQLDNDFYIIDQGRAKVETYDAFGRPYKLRTLREGHFVGQFSIINDVPHLVTVVAAAPLDTYKLRRDDFLKLMETHDDFRALFEDPAIRDVSFADSVRDLAFFGQLNSTELADISDKLKVRRLPEGADVMGELLGDAGVAILADGQINVTRQNNPTLKKFTLQRGRFISYLSRNQGVQAVTEAPTTVFYLSPEDLDQFIQDVPRMAKAVEHKDVIDALKSIDLFKSADDNDLRSLAWVVGRAMFRNKKQYICHQGEREFRYYMVEWGEVELRQLNKDGQKPHDGPPLIRVNLPASDNSKAIEKPMHVVGENALFLGRPLEIGMWTTEPTSVFYLEGNDFNFIRESNFGFEQQLGPGSVVKQAFQYNDFKFPGRGQDEMVLYYCHRHWFWFVRQLFRPFSPVLSAVRTSTGRLQDSSGQGVLWEVAITAVFIIALAIALLWQSFSGFGGDALTFLGGNVVILGTAFTALFAGWLTWTWLDWRNDYLIVTNRRVIRREKVILIYEDQAQTELDKIQSVGRNQGFLGSMLGFYDLDIITAAADQKIFFDMAPQPSRIGQWLRAIPLFRFFPASKEIVASTLLGQLQNEKQSGGQALSSQSKWVSMQNAIRGQIGKNDVDSWDIAKTADAPPPKDTAWQKRRKDWSKRLKVFFDTVIPWRYQGIKPDPEKNTYIWRQHWSTLFRKTWDSSAAFAVCTALLIIYFAEVQVIEPIAVLATFLSALNWFVLIFYFAIAFWFWWEVADWGNDVYILTDQYISDVEKDPLWFSEQTNQAPLQNIENVFFRQDGIFDNLFNVGDIVIETAGSEPITFIRIGRPREAQNLIFELMQKAKSEAARKAQQEEQRKFLTWIDVYHNTYVHTAS